MPLRRCLIAVASAIVAAAAPSTADAASAPTLISVGHKNRHPTAVWSLPAHVESSVVEVAKRPDVASNGQFWSENVVVFDLVREDDTSWLYESQLAPGRYFIHVKGFDNSCFHVDGAECGAAWSNVLELVIEKPQPKPKPPAKVHRVRTVVVGDTSIAGFRVKTDGSLAGAIAALGKPSQIRPAPYNSCVVTWRALGVAMTFYTLSLGRACDPKAGRFGLATLTGKVWRTSSGLRVGDSTSAIRKRHPRARFRRDRAFGAGWWLVTRYTRIGDGAYYPGLMARVNGSRVSALVVRYAAGGD